MGSPNREYPYVALLAGAICMSLGLYLGLGVNFGWWGLLFWLGFGAVFSALVEAIRG